MEYHAGYAGTAGRNREEMGVSVNIFSILIAYLVDPLATAILHCIQD